MHEWKLFLSAGRFGPSFSHYSWSTVHYARCRRSKNSVASQAFSGNFSVDQKDLWDGCKIWKFHFFRNRLISITCSNLINRHVKMFPLVLLLLFCWLFDLFLKLLPARISMISRNINLYDNLLLCRMILGWVNFQLSTTVSKKPFGVLLLRRLLSCLLCICITKEVSIPMRKPTNQERYLLNRQLLKPGFGLHCQTRVYSSVFIKDLFTYTLLTFPVTTSNIYPKMFIFEPSILNFFSIIFQTIVLWRNHKLWIPGGYSGFQVMGMIEWEQKFKTKKNP